MSTTLVQTYTTGPFSSVGRSGLRVRRSTTGRTQTPRFKEHAEEERGTFAVESIVNEAEPVVTLAEPEYGTIEDVVPKQELHDDMVSATTMQLIEACPTSTPVLQNPAASECGLRLIRDSPEMAWLRQFDLICPKKPRSVTGTLVVPLCNLSYFSFDYQLYLALIFHTNNVTRIAHWTCTPFINLFLLAYLAQYPVVEGSDLLHMNNYGTVASIVMLTWYMVWAAISGLELLVIFMIPIVYCLWATANFYVSAIYVDDAAWYLHPLAMMFFFGAIQSASHGVEKKYPPRANGTLKWMNMRDYLFSRGILGYIGTFLMFLVGWMAEMMASPRLLFVHTMIACYGCGYRPERCTRVKEAAKKALESDNPALDYIGIGGALPPNN